MADWNVSFPSSRGHMGFDSTLTDELFLPFLRTPSFVWKPQHFMRGFFSKLVIIVFICCACGILIVVARKIL